MAAALVKHKTWATRVALFFGVWTFLGLFFASRSILIYSRSEESFDWRLPLKLSLAEWYGWALLAPVVVWLARRYAFERDAWKRMLAIHLVSGTVVSITKVLLDGLVQPLVGGYGSSFLYKMHTNWITYASIVAVVQAVTYYRKYRERQLRASQLEAQLARAQLDVLKRELHPHFLFNTLHAISTLMHRDADAADRMLSRLSDLLRHSLEHLGEQTTTLKDELEFLELYLEIEQMRFGDRLAVRVDVAADTLHLSVPNLVLQPLVENAVRHAVAPRSAGGAVEIRARQDGGRLEIEVEDDGPGFSPRSSNAPRGRGTGIGLAHTRARLEGLYGSRQRFDLREGARGGALCHVELPAEEWRAT